MFCLMKNQKKTQIQTKRQNMSETKTTALLYTNKNNLQGNCERLCNLCAKLWTSQLDSVHFCHKMNQYTFTKVYDLKISILIGSQIMGQWIVNPLQQIISLQQRETKCKKSINVTAINLYCEHHCQCPQQLHNLQAQSSVEIPNPVVVVQ